ncbi:MAG: hypothetical protein AAFM92_11515 [Pseudomonadota bacterium]
MPSIHGASVHASGRDVILSGLVDSQAEREALLESLEATQGYRAIQDDTTLLPVASPFEFRSVHAGGRVVSVSGHVPTEQARRRLEPVLGDAADALLLASGAPDGWLAAVNASLKASQSLKETRTHLSDNELALQGLAARPGNHRAAMAALGKVPENYTQDVAIDLEDDGTPFTLTVTYERGVTARAAGKLPASMSRRALAPLGPDLLADALFTARINSESGLWRDAAQAAIAALAALETGELRIIARAGTIVGAGTRADLVAAESALADLPSGFAISMELSLVDDGRPIALSGSKDGDGLRLSGKLPFGATAFGLGLPVLPSGIDVAEIDATDGAFLALAATGISALAELETGSLIVKDGVSARLALEGEVRVPGEAEAIAERLAGAAGEVSLNLRPRDDGRPLSLEATRTADGTELRGKLPADTVLDLGPGVSIAGIELGPRNFDAAAEAGLAALALLDDGSLSLDGTRLTLRGQATRSRIRAALAALEALPEEFEASTELSPRDDGLPLGFTAEKAGDTVTLIGKMPFGTEPSALGLDAFEEAMIVSEVDANAPSFLGVSQAGLRALAALRNGRLFVADADEEGAPARLRIEGAVTRSELDAVNAALGELPAGVAPVIDVVFADDGTPLRVIAAFDGAELSVAGKLPFGTAPEDLGLETFGAEVEVAEIPARASDFRSTVVRGLAALALLERGELEVMDAAEVEGRASLVLRGVALTPDRLDAALDAAELEAADITVLDDGTPPSFTLSYTAAEGATLAGKLPMGLSTRGVAEALGLPMLASQAVEGLVGDASVFDVSSVRPWLPALAALELRVGADGLDSIEITPEPGVDAELLLQGMGDAFAVPIRLAASEMPMPNSERTHALTGRIERFSGGAWLPLQAFEPSFERCDAESAERLAEAELEFLEDSARLSLRAARELNALAGIIAHCHAALPELRIAVSAPYAGREVSAETADLSQARAEALIAALILRGVDEDALSAQPASKLAKNAISDEAQPRDRVTLTWSQP